MDHNDAVCCGRKRYDRRSPAYCAGSTLVKLWSTAKVVERCGLGGLRSIRSKVAERSSSTLTPRCFAPSSCAPSPLRGCETLDPPHVDYDK
jgi:hypothetical protein